MAEYVRTVHVRVEVDTNKNTYVLDRDEVPLSEADEVVRDFIEGLDLS